MSHFKSHPVLPPLYHSSSQPLPSIRDVMSLINSRTQGFPLSLPHSSFSLPLSMSSNLSISSNSSLFLVSALLPLLPYYTTPYSHQNAHSSLHYYPPLTPIKTYTPQMPIPSYSVGTQLQPRDIAINEDRRHQIALEENTLVKRKTRNNLPKETTQMLLRWLHMHLSHPYPNLYEKCRLMQITGLNQQQLSNWFINARRRKIKQIIGN